MMVESWIAIALGSILILWVLLKIGDLANKCQDIWLSDREEREEERMYLRENIHQLSVEIINSLYGPRTDAMLREALLESIRLYREASR